MRAVEWVDEYLITKNRKVYTKNQLNIPGIATLGFYHTREATDPLVHHYHRDCIEIHFLIKGCARFAAEDKFFTLTGGDIFLTPTNLPHSTGNIPIQAYTVYWVQINLNDKPFLFLTEGWANELKTGLAAQKTGIVHRSVSSCKLLDTVFEQITSGSQNKQYQGLSLFIMLLHEISDNKKFDEKKESDEHLPSNINDAISWINEHINEKIDLEDVAKAAHSSLSHFKSQFYKSVGISPGTFINMKKIERAEELLLSGKSATQVSELLGFSSGNYFSSVFKKFTLMSPSEYANKFCKNKPDDQPSLLLIPKK